MRPLVTLDNNAILAVRNDEPDAGAVQQLLTFNRAGVITLNVTQSTALERRRDGAEVEIRERQAWLVEQGIAPESIFTSSRSIGFSTPEAPDIPTFDPDLEYWAAQRVHAILFPMIPFRWHDYREQELAYFAAERQAPDDLQRTFRDALDELDCTRYGIYIPPTTDAGARRAQHARPGGSAHPLRASAPQVDECQERCPGPICPPLRGVAYSSPRARRVRYQRQETAHTSKTQGAPRAPDAWGDPAASRSRHVHHLGDRRSTSISGADTLTVTCCCLPRYGLGHIKGSYFGKMGSDRSLLHR